MEPTSFLQDLGSLGPALGSVAVIGIICWKLLQIFEKHGAAIESFSAALQGQTEVLKEIDKNMQANTQATERMSMLLQQKTTS
jgi:hypothetical protein